MILSLYACLEKEGDMTLRILCMSLEIEFIHDYLQLISYMHVYFFFLRLFLQLVSSIYVFVYAKGEKHSSLMHVHIKHSLHIFMIIAMHELRGSFYEA